MLTFLLEELPQRAVLSDINFHKKPVLHGIAKLQTSAGGGGGHRFAKNFQIYPYKYTYVSFAGSPQFSCNSLEPKSKHPEGHFGNVSVSKSLKVESMVFYQTLLGRSDV